VFFDFEPTGGSVKRKRLELADASNILTAGERRAIDEFFIDPLSGPNEHAMLQILKKVEVAYTTGLITRGIKMEPTIQKQLVIAACCVAANVGLGKLSNLVSLPFSMDTIGTILGAAMLPWPVLIVTAILSSILEAIAIQPPFIYFVGTQIAIAIAARLLLFAGLFDSLARSVFAGLIIGIISAIVSAPVIAFVFGGIAVPSVSAVNALFLASGHSLWASVVSGSLIVESIDKMAAGAIVWLVLIRLAPDLRQ
jgi:energy-coupling factor transport system substrate-specific component